MSSPCSPVDMSNSIGLTCESTQPPRLGVLQLGVSDHASSIACHVYLYMRLFWKLEFTYSAVVENRHHKCVSC